MEIGGEVSGDSVPDDANANVVHVVTDETVDANGLATRSQPYGPPPAPETETDGARTITATNQGAHRSNIGQIRNYAVQQNQLAEQ